MRFRRQQSEPVDIQQNGHFRLRIEINRELQGLPAALDAALSRIGGWRQDCRHLHHSPEDRIVKRRFAADSKETSPIRLPVIPDDARPSLRLLTRGAEVPSDPEISENPRAQHPQNCAPRNA